METTEFFDRVLAPDGYYCLFAIDAKNDRRVQKFYPSKADIVNAAHNLDQNGYDAYFALATFEEGNSRRVDNVKQLNSFFLDLDCGPSKDFATQDEAVTALRSFCAQNNLPKPTLVNSGRGVHVYWFLKEAVSPTEWLPVAERLKKLCAECNLLADPAVTADAARVLRVPFTHNHKSDPPALVRFFGRKMSDPVDLDYFSGLLGLDAIPVPKAIEYSSSSALMDALIGNKECIFK